MANKKTIFQKIIDGEIPSERIYEDNLAIVIKDINPQAPTHVLIIPKTDQIPKLSDATEKHQALLGHSPYPCKIVRSLRESVEGNFVEGQIQDL